ncbi:MAG: GMP/IMP nucleotidase [Candidatus Desulfofervidaceae bacterium]|nr:GMP/IMP nucleotidase [Candidatus Desulfofervidaceae bacterium]
MKKVTFDNPKEFWAKIDWVLLDMDGTLLDKYFDDYFWETLVPQKYAEKYGLTVQDAKEELMRFYRREEGTLNWTDLDFWSKKLNLDIPALKEQISHLIKIHPYVEDLLNFLHQIGKKTALVTNAHYKSLDLKLRQTQLDSFFDHVICAFDVGLPKEDKKFWALLQQKLEFDPQRTLFIDDSEGPLLAAKEAGIKYVIFKSRPSSKLPSKLPQNNFFRIEYFKELM